MLLDHYRGLDFTGQGDHCVLILLQLQIKVLLCHNGRIQRRSFLKTNIWKNYWIFNFIPYFAIFDPWFRLRRLQWILHLGLSFVFRLLAIHFFAHRWHLRALLCLQVLAVLARGFRRLICIFANFSFSIGIPILSQYRIF